MSLDDVFIEKDKVYRANLALNLEENNKLSTSSGSTKILRQSTERLLLTFFVPNVTLWQSPSKFLGLAGVYRLLSTV